MVQTTGMGNRKMRKSVTRVSQHLTPLPTTPPRLTHVQPGIRPPHALRLAVLLLHCKVPVRLQRDARRKRHERHVEVRDDHDAEQDLARHARPLEREEVDVEQEDGDLGEGERE